MKSSKRLNILIGSLFLLIATSCNKDPEVISSTPSISFVQITPLTAKEFVDDIVIKISYLDGDGDLGENNPDVNNLFVSDTRNNVTYKYRIPELTPAGSTIAIKGNFNIIINGTSLINGGNTESVTYNIYVIDRAGNKSETIITEPIQVTAQ